MTSSAIASAWSARRESAETLEGKKNEDAAQWASDSAATQGAATTRTALGSKAGTPFDFTGLLVILPAAHLFFDSAPLDQLAEATHRFLN